MNFVKVDSVPKRTNHKLHDYLTEFMRMNTKTVKVVFSEGEYSSPRVGASGLKVASICDIYGEESTDKEIAECEDFEE